MAKYKPAAMFVFAIVVIFLGVMATVSHIKRSYARPTPKVVTSTVTKPALDLPAFNPFADWGVTPSTYTQVPINWQSSRYANSVDRRRRQKRKWVCTDRLRYMPKTGVARVCGYVVFWI